MKTTLRPRATSLWPSSEERSRSAARVHTFGPERFERYEDYFFFLHIDPRNRAIHVIGMLIGMAWFAWSAMLLYRLSPWCLATFVIGHLFFTGFGVLGHVIYDGTSEARTSARYALKAFPWILAINFRTLSLTYQPLLARFVERYPFAVEAFDLVERER